MAPDTTRETAEKGKPGGPRRWLRPAGLFLVVLGLSVVEPGLLVAVPYLMLVLVLPSRRFSAVLAAGVAAILVFGGAHRSGLWFAERGWAILVGGWFVALTLRWPSSRFTSRGLGAVAGAAAVVLAFFRVRPGTWSVLNWLILDRMRAGVSGALDALQALGGDPTPVPDRLVEAVYQTVSWQARVFPALIGLASLAALGAAWWLWVRLAHGSDRGLAPVGEFRFNDHLVWLFIGGILLVVLGLGDGWTRAGSNAVVFMGALYALRGAAVVVFFNGGISLLGGVVLALGLLFVAPVILVGALLIGLGDTWLDLRERARRLMA